MTSITPQHSKTFLNLPLPPPSFFCQIGASQPGVGLSAGVWNQTLSNGPGQRRPQVHGDIGASDVFNQRKNNQPNLALVE
ncbi:unnamed protein product [Gadus morhua 'NCC']